MSQDRFTEALASIGSFRGQTLEQVLGRTPFGTPLRIQRLNGSEVFFDRLWPYYANPPIVVGPRYMPLPVVRVFVTETVLIIEVI